MRILIAEDEKKIADFIRRGLKEEGYAADLAASGPKALELATENDYDLLLLDRIYRPHELANAERPEDFEKRRSELEFV